ncbi:methyltransferase [Perilla frutescens var. hirtella]|nr:methyltransferase [Perilla frutescens var. hirtella]
MFKDKFYTNTVDTLYAARDNQLLCDVSDDRRRLISNLEPLIEAEPLDVWEGLGKEEKNIKYLSSAIDLTPNRRFIYVDLGARDYDSSIGSWFEKQYPKHNRTFEIYAVEADAAFHDQYRRRRGVTLLPYAAWIKNETVVFGSKPIIVKEKVWRMRPFGRIEADAAEDGMSKVVRVAAFDFVEWLKKTVRAEDFVVVKMDVEGTEITLVRELVKRGAICLIDELFMECHFDRYVKCCSGDRINRFNFSYAQCYHLFADLRSMGCVVHQWW